MADLSARPLFHGSRSTPLVGRGREYGVLRDRLDNALAGRGGLALIGGEAGIGKTTLAEALCAGAWQQGALVLIGRCYDLTETPPYGPWREALATQAAAPGLPAPLGDGEVAASQAALFAAVRDHLVALTVRQPIVLLLDDLHWADPASLDLLRILARQVSGLPLLLLATYRSDELSRRHPLFQLLPLLVREAQATQLDLRPLPGEAVRDLLRTRYALATADEDRLASYLRERAEGHPFFLGELLNTLEEVGDLNAVGDSWQLGDLGALRVPRLLRQVVEARLARLPDEDQRLLAVAAVIGQEVPLDLWSAVAGVGEDALLETMERASASRLAEETEDGTRARFVHALVREALYEGIQPSRRRAWHRRTGESLVATPVPDPDAVAHHFRQAGDPRAAEWLAKAGERAQRAYAYLTAAERYEAALALLPDDESRLEERAWLHLRVAQVCEMADARRALLAVNEAGRLADLLGDRVMAAAVLVERGGINAVLGAPPDALEAGVAAVDALTSDERARLNRLVTLGAETSDLNPYAALLIYVEGWGGRPEDTLIPGERFVAQAPPPTTGHGPSVAFAGYFGDTYLVMGIAHAMLGRPNEARQAFAEARAAYGPAGDPWQLGEVATDELTQMVLPYYPERVAERRRLADDLVEQFGRASSMGMVEPRLLCVPLLIVEGEWAEARALVEEGVTNANLSGGRIISRIWLGQLAREQGRPDEAWSQVNDVLPGGHTEPATGMWHPHCQRLAATLALDTGDLATARAWLEAHDRDLTWRGLVLGLAEGELSWAGYHRAAANPVAAREHAARALAHASDPRQPLALLAAHRLLGELATTARSHADAVTHLDAALALADACAAPYERALTLLALADLRVATSQQSAAQELLSEARTILEPLNARPALARADLLAARLTTAPPAPVTLPFGLTVREVEVLRLVAQGLTDAQAAEQLYLSTNTIKTHLRSIYNKLDVPSRTAAARFATDHGLA